MDATWEEEDGLESVSAIPEMTFVNSSISTTQRATTTEVIVERCPRLAGSRERTRENDRLADTAMIGSDFRSVTID
jgi:hypothetical protein